MSDTLITERNALREHLITRSFGKSTCGVLTFPTILLPLPESQTRDRTTTSLRSRHRGELPKAEMVLQALRALGLRGERVRMDQEGCVGLFRRLLQEPPWEEVQIEDCEDLTPDRAEALTPLYRRSESAPVLVEKFRQYLIERHRQSQLAPNPIASLLVPLHSETAQSIELDNFVEELKLARGLGPTKVKALAEIVFGDGEVFSEFSAAPGLPDLFVWDADRDPIEWFFAEVKGPGDYLQKSQIAWLRTHWDRIEGRFAVVATV